MSDEVGCTVLESTHQAVRTYARVEFEVLTRRVIFRLQRFRASGIFGDDYAYKTLWDEYCHEVQQGPHDLLQGVWEGTMSPFLDDVIERLPSHVAVLLSIFAVWELEEHDEACIVGAVWPDGIRSVLRSEVAALAGKRSLDRFSPRTA